MRLPTKELVRCCTRCRWFNVQTLTARSDEVTNRYQHFLPVLADMSTTENDTSSLISTIKLLYKRSANVLIVCRKGYCLDAWNVAVGNVQAATKQ